MKTIQRSKSQSDLFDVLATNEDVVGLNIGIETALASCKHFEVILKPSAVEFLLDELARLRQYEAEEYNRQISGD